MIADLPIVSGRIEANPNARLSDGHVILGHDGSMDPRAGIGLRDEHLALRDSVRGWAARHCPPAVVRTGLDADEHVLPPFWGDLAGQGWIGIAVDEAAGGEGYGLAEAVVVVEELGRVLAPGPFVPSSLAAVALDRFGDAGLRPLVGELASGRRVGTVAVGPAPVPATPTPGRRGGRGRGVGRGPVRRGRRRAGPADRSRRGRRPHRRVGGRRRRRRRRLAGPVARPDPPGGHRPGRPARAARRPPRDVPARRRRHPGPRRRAPRRRVRRGGGVVRRHRGRARARARAVRPADRSVPGGEAPVRRHAVRPRAGPGGHLGRGAGHRRDATRRPSPPRSPGPSPPRPPTARQGLHPGARRHRLHLGARRPPLPEAGDRDAPADRRRWALAGRRPPGSPLAGVRGAAAVELPTEAEGGRADVRAFLDDLRARPKVEWNRRIADVGVPRAALAAPVGTRRRSARAARRRRGVRAGPASGAPTSRSGRGRCRRSWSTAPRRSRRGGWPPRCAARSRGARCSASRAPARTWPPSPPRPCGSTAAGG